jgi:hypothetical protein
MTQFKPNPPRILAMTGDQFDRLLADTRREALEEACKVVCNDCTDGLPLITMEGSWLHETNSKKVWVCKADPIRKLMEAPK